ncbi:MAG: ABC transporter ATP-binding protein, partial [Bacteroidota bacterium]
MIEIQSLTKIFRLRGKSLTAVNSLTLTINRGEILGLLGPNGAGKTTTVRLLSTLITPTSGTAYVNGYSILTDPAEVRASLGVSLGDERSFYYRLSGYQNLEFFATLQNIPRQQLKGRIMFLLEKMDLAEAKDVKFMKYSAGMKRKLNICRALLTDPPIYFFDEPTAALDPEASRRIRETILDLKREGKTVLLTTQNMLEADELCDRIAIINKGKLIVLSTAGELKRKLRTCTVQLCVPDSTVLPLDVLRSEPFVGQI